MGARINDGGQRILDGLNDVLAGRYDVVTVKVTPPRRVQLQRTKGWRMPENTVKVDRSTRFGNPVSCTAPHDCSRQPCGCCPQGDRCCVDVFREFVVSGIEDRECRTGSLMLSLDAIKGYPRRKRLIEGLPNIRGKNLACWCALNQPCHADVLLDLANPGFRCEPVR